MTLYIYEYCPFCIRARMIFPLKSLPVTLHPLLDDDIETPTRLVGRKLLPILAQADVCMGESLDIVRHVDRTQGDAPCLTGAQRPEIAQWCNDIEHSIYQLSMPRWVDMPVHEFSTPDARRFYIQGKEHWLGSFESLLRQTPALIEAVHTALAQLDRLIVADSHVNDALSEDDILLFPLLHQLSVVKGVHYPAKVDAYRQGMAARTQVPLYDTHAR